MSSLAFWITCYFAVGAYIYSYGLSQCKNNPERQWIIELFREFKILLLINLVIFCCLWPVIYVRAFIQAFRKRG